MPFHGGLDWGGASHALCIIDGAGQVVGRLDVRHDAAGLADMVARLERIAPPADLPIAIERPSGLIVDTLVEAGHPVVPVHPNVVKACRPRYRAAAAKSDPGDAFMLADILRTDGHRFRPLLPVSDDIKALRALVRGRGDLVAARTAIANQLRSLLEGFWPGAAAIFAAIDSPIALAFILRYPTPDSASRLGEKRLASFMAQNAYCGRRSPAELLARLRAAPAGLAGDAEAEAKGELARALAIVLERIVGEIAKLSAKIEHAVAELPDGRVVMSFPRSGRICAAQILAELGDVRERFPTEDQLAAEAGVCPVTHASGKSRGVVFRWACNKNLRAAVTCFADNSRHACPWAAATYRKARDRGCRHPHAIRILARAWLRVLWKAWQNHALYDPQKHRAAAQIAA
ncbi:IS110 family transposase [Aurantimonas sp. 22II-16-19i]|uniref:IS110 family transposase n=1 Tax=Aurantimonas sp. 22II-16-19i TaxID=1317114 RepID=UPI0009F7B8F1|nr:IS110 family transposase [Aurantimonas sp. 22II-16-19i]ORE92308.1 transposase [Aurantimonas sp. 22II-16-19i]